MTEIKKSPIELGVNPFSAEKSGYGRVVNGQFVSTYAQGSPQHSFHFIAHDYFQQLVGAEKFVCLAGRTVARTGEYAFCAYEDMTDPKTAEGVCHDLIEFANEFEIGNPNQTHHPMFRSFVAAFKSPQINSQLEGAEFLYTLLRNMHNSDVKYFNWAKELSNDTDSVDFGFSVGELGYFIPSFHHYTSSPSRKSDFTFVVFNAHAIFTLLRSQGKFEKLRDLIRSRQNWVHPHLGDHGETNEWKQYALVDPDPQSQLEEKRIRRKILGDCPFS